MYPRILSSRNLREVSITWFVGTKTAKQGFMVDAGLDEVKRGSNDIDRKLQHFVSSNGEKVHTSWEERFCFDVRKHAKPAIST